MDHEQFSDSRKEAELRAVPKFPVPNPITSTTGQDAERLLAKLQTQKTELETQNKELKRLQLLLEESRNKYINLYDYAPVAYFTINQQGIILEVNLTGATLLATEKSSLIGSRFSDFVDKRFVSTFYHHIQYVYASHAKQKCEVRFCRVDGAFFDGRLETTLAVGDGDSNGLRLHMIVSDITEIKQEICELKDKEEHYKGVFDNAGVGILALDRNGNVLQANQALLSMLGYNEEDLCGLSFADITHPDDREISRSNLESHIAGKKASNRFEKRYLKKDGGSIWGDVSTSSVLDTNGKPTKIIAVIVDITRHKLAEQELLEANEQWQRTFDAAQDLISIMSKDQKIVKVNRIMAETFGLTPEKFVDHHCYKLAHGTDEPPDYCPFIKMLDSGEAQFAVIREPRLEGEYEVTVSPILGQDGQIVGGVHIARNITERNRAEEELWQYKNHLEEMVEQRTWDLRQSEVRFSDLVEITSDFVWEIDQKGVYTYFSPRISDLLGYTPEDIIGVNFLNFMGRKGAVGSSDIFKAALDSQKPFKGLESVHTHRDGHDVFLETSGVPITNLDGQFVGYRGVCRDITKSKQAQEALEQRTKELERSNRDLEQFAYVAAHDLREPLVAVGAYLKVLERLTHNTLEDVGRKCMTKAINLTLRMDAMLQALLAYSRLNINSVSYEPTDCNACLADALSNLGLAIVKNEAIVTNDPMPTVMANPAQIVLVFQNLIANAIKFRGQGPPKVHIGCKANESEYTFSVNDNGIGIDPPYLERIFNMFERIKDSGPSGTGIGLSTCRKIVERYGGRIWVESKIGKGSTFYFTLPKE
ncbi:MAG: PAS domain S-box protein [Desulfomonilaceae bacterium]